MHDTMIHDKPDQFITNNSNIANVLVDDSNISGVSDREEKMERSYSQKELNPSTKEDIQELKAYMDEAIGVLKRDVDWFIYKQNNTETSLLLQENMQSKLYKQAEISFQILEDIQSKVTQHDAKMRRFEEHLGRLQMSASYNHGIEFMSKASELVSTGSNNNTKPGHEIQDAELGNPADKMYNCTLIEEQLSCLKDKKIPSDEVGQGAVKTIDAVGDKVDLGSVLLNVHERVDETIYATWTNAKKRRMRRLKVKKRKEEESKRLAQKQDDEKRENRDNNDGDKENVDNSGNENKENHGEDDEITGGKNNEDSSGSEDSKNNKDSGGTEEKKLNDDNSGNKVIEKNDDNFGNEDTEMIDSKVGARQKVKNDDSNEPDETEKINNNTRNEEIERKENGTRNEDINKSDDKGGTEKREKNDDNSGEEEKRQSDDNSKNEVAEKNEDKYENEEKVKTDDRGENKAKEKNDANRRNEGGENLGSNSGNENMEKNGDNSGNKEKTINQNYSSNKDRDKNDVNDGNQRITNEGDSAEEEIIEFDERRENEKTGRNDEKIGTVERENSEIRHGNDEIGNTNGKSGNEDSGKSNVISGTGETETNDDRGGDEGREKNDRKGEIAMIEISDNRMDGTQMRKNTEDNRGNGEGRKIYGISENEEREINNVCKGDEKNEENDDNSGYEERKKNKISAVDEEREKSKEISGYEEREMRDNNSRNEEKEEKTDDGDEKSGPKPSQINEQENQVEENRLDDLKNSHCNAVDIVNNATENKYTGWQKSSLDCSKRIEIINQKQIMTQLDRDGELKFEENNTKLNKKNRNNCSHYISCLFLVCLLFVFLFMLFYPYDPMCQLILIAYLMYRVKL